MPSSKMPGPWSWCQSCPSLWGPILSLYQGQHHDQQAMPCNYLVPLQGGRNMPTCRATSRTPSVQLGAAKETVTTSLDSEEAPSLQPPIKMWKNTYFTYENCWECILSVLTTKNDKYVRLCICYKAWFTHYNVFMYKNIMVYTINMYNFYLSRGAKDALYQKDHKIFWCSLSAKACLSSGPTKTWIVFLNHLLSLSPIILILKMKKIVPAYPQRVLWGSNEILVIKTFLRLQIQYDIISLDSTQGCQLVPF